MSAYRVGIDVGGTKLAYGLFDQEMNLLGRGQSPTDSKIPAEMAIDSIATDVDELLEKHNIKRSELEGVGACVPSYINAETGYIIYTTNLPTWNGLPMRDLMSEKFGVPVQIDNDANAAALAEHHLGAGRGHRHMIYITVSTGVGGGIIINNKLFRGNHGMAGEIGHVLVSDTWGLKCGCGNRGCIESIASGPSMSAYAAWQIHKKGRKSKISDFAGDGTITGKDIAMAAADGDALAIETVEHAGKYLGRLFSSLYQTLDIDHIVYGGGAIKVSPLLMQEAEATFKEITKFAQAYPVTFVPAELGDNTGIIGAALLLDDLV